jgi:hypothetical protein
MSYLNNLRLVFSGQFQADTNTINNDVRHFDNDAFKPEYQQYGDYTNGWWNPCGSGAFRLINCQVTRVGYTDGTTVNDSSQDPVIGMLIGGSDSRVSGKIVDIDPQMQMMSELWGLTMRLTDGETPGFFEGKYLPAPFRDILFSRQICAVPGDKAAAAIYQSVLTDLEWNKSLGDSRFLQELKDEVSKLGDFLSVRMMVYGYNDDHTNPEFTLGRVSGVIGPALPDEPKTFTLGRRFAPANGISAPAGRLCQCPDGKPNILDNKINFFDAQVDADSSTIFVDLSNALPLLGSQGDFIDIGSLQLVVLNNENTQQGHSLLEADFEPLGDHIPYRDPNWMNDTGAIFSATISSNELMEKVQSKPLGLLQTDSNKLLIRETKEGLLVRVDQVVHRMNPTAKAKVDFYVSRYGAPCKGEEIEVSVAIPMEDQGGNPDDQDLVNTKVPVINIPASAIAWAFSDPKKSVTERDGKISFSFYATVPGNPRGYLDGQLYFIDYKPANVDDYVQYQFDIITLHVYDAFIPPKVPTWDDLYPIMLQYGNLYPVMSRMLVDLSSYASVVKHRQILELAFSLPIEDPNHMPVSRDLSEGKRKMILQWLTMKNDQGEYLLPCAPHFQTDQIKDDLIAQLGATTPSASCTFHDSIPSEPEMGAKETVSTSDDFDVAKMGPKELAYHQYRQARRKILGEKK